MKKLLLATLMSCISVMLSSCAKNAIEGYEWLEGEWKFESEYLNAKMVVTKNKFTIECDDQRFQIENNPIQIGQTHNYYYGENGSDILALDVENISIAIDEENESIILLAGEYESYTLVKVAEAEDLELENKELNEPKSENSNKKKYKSSSNKLIDAFNKSEYIIFETSYVDDDLSQRPYYIVLHPFVYSEDATHGIVYYVCYGEDKYNSYRKGEVTATLYYYGEYEVFGNYVRVREIVQVNNEKRAEPLIYTFNDINGGLNLYGGFPRHRTEKQYYRQITNTPNLIINLLEKENICRHN